MCPPNLKWYRQVPQERQTGKKYGMQTLNDAIEELLSRHQISAEDAYTNCNDKPRFLKYLRRQPADFTEI